MQQNGFSIGAVRDFWNGIALEYDRINATFNWSHTERFSTMRKYLPKKPGMKILNVWSRTGNAVTAIREINADADLLNLEVSDVMREIAAKRYPQEKFESTDLHDLPCDTESIDVIVSLETLEHVPDPLHFLLECNRVLKVGGRMIFSTPPAWAELPLRMYETFFENHGEGPHRFRSVNEILRTLKNCDFRIVEHRGTVFMPVGPRFFKKAMEALHQNFLRYIGLDRLTIRHFFVVEKSVAVDPVWAKIREEIARPRLSMHSGTEIGLSQGTLRYGDRDGECVPELTGTGRVPEICYLASPEINPNYPAMQQAVFGHPVKNLLLGEYRRIAVANATDETVRRSGASGGILTSVLLHLLETGKIKGAVVLTMSEKDPCRAEPVIAKTKERIIASAQSKYTISPVNTILGDLEKEEGPLAFVGLPHQVFAIRKLQQLKHPSVRSIEYVFGPFFGNELYGSAIDSFLRKFHAKRSDVTGLSFRAGEWPGYMQAILRDGKIAKMPKFHANYLIPFHITRNSLLSHDLMNEFTDLSGGDAWAPVYEERGKGFSLLITRSEKGDAIIKEMEAAGKLALKDIDETEAIGMQSHGLDLKKRGTFLRIERLRFNDQRYPDYGLELGHVGTQRRFFEWILGCAFAFCSTGFARWIADKTPDSIIGPMFSWFRVRWKSATKGVKRAGLTGIPLKIRSN